MIRLRAYLFGAASLSLLATPACYTLMKHPKVRRVVYEEVSDRRCNTCHVEDELWSFHYPPNQRFWLGAGYDAWDHYYFVPWWYNDYWYYDSRDPATIPLRSRRLRPVADKTRGTRGGSLRYPQVKKLPSARTDDRDAAKEEKPHEKPSKKRTVRPKKAKQKGGDDGGS